MNAADPNRKPAPQREDELFLAAGQRTGAERAAFLNDACHDDAALRQRLEARLAAHAVAGSLLADPPTVESRATIKVDLADDPAGAAVGLTISPNKLRETGGKHSHSLLASPPAAPSRMIPRLVITAIATLLGAGGGLWVFGLSPLILLGVLLGFLVGQTIHGIVYPDNEAQGMLGAQAGPLPTGEGVADPGANNGRTPAPSSGANGSLNLSLVAGVLAIGFLGLVAQAGWFQGEGASLLFMFIVLPVIAVLGLLGGPTATAAARRTLNQIQAGQRPESDRRPAKLALYVSHVMTVALLGFLLWLLLATFPHTF